MKIILKTIFVFVTVALASCTSPSQRSSEAISAGPEDSAAFKRHVANAANGDSVDSLPALHDPKKLYSSVLQNVNNGRNLDEVQASRIATRISKYIAFLGIRPVDAAYRKVVPRLLNSSTQFILCDQFTDFECLEKEPELVPATEWRRDTDPRLGAPLIVNEPLKLKYFFTNQFDVLEEKIDKKSTMASKLGNIISSEDWDTISLGLYGMDDIDGSMKPVFSALSTQMEKGAQVKAVIDAGNIDKDSKDFPFIFTHIPFDSDKPTIFSLNEKNRTNLDFEYGNTPELLSQINKGLSSDKNARARLEWPNDGIMHNKFIVFEKNGKHSLWTGTANISRTCMGTERNSNLGVYIENDSIAKIFQDEFNEMFEYQDKPFVDSKGRLVAKKGKEIPVGRFHKNKRPNTKRYVKFSDGNEVRIHFSPTDDAEHRVIIPMLLSAQKGDQIRISMFGGGGYEFVRAFQYAVAQGAQVRIVFDAFTGSGKFTWLNNLEANLREKNPYAAKPKGSIAVRLNKWPKLDTSKKAPLNHHKSATMTRLVDGEEHVEMIILGSQNWSQVGNDQNDENVISIRNLNRDVPIGKVYNKHFDERLWALSVAGEVDLSIPASKVKPSKVEDEGQP